MKLDKSITKENNITNYFSRTSTGFYQPNANKIERLFPRCTFSSKYHPKLFSLLDINDKITNSRGTSLPIQFKRLTEEETERQFGFSYREELNYRLALIRDYLNNIHPSKNKTKAVDESTKNSENILPIKNLEINIETNNKGKKIKICKPTDEKKGEQNKKKIKTEINIRKLKPKSRNDVWLPKGYGEYELLVNNHKLLLQKIKDDPFAGKLPYFSMKKIKSKSYESDIFFNKPNNDRCFVNLKNSKQKDYLTSDIFNLKNDEQNLLKTSENFLFKAKNIKKYGLTTESDSQWSPKNLIPSFLNSPSMEFNILCPNKKNIGATRDNILEELQGKKNKNKEEKKSFNINYLNPIFRQKGLGEFIDITRNGGNNPGRNYIEWYKKYPSCFTKCNETCSTFNNAYKFYKNIVDKPFSLNPTLKFKK